MRKDKVLVEKGGIGFLGALTLLFAAGKIFGFLDWSWLWVFSPIWIPFIALVIILIVIGVIQAVAD